MSEEIESFRRELRDRVDAGELPPLTLPDDDLEVVVVVVPEGMHPALWRCGALVAPGRVALAWLFG